MFEEVITGILLQSGLFIYINGHMYEVITPVAFNRAAYSVFSKSFKTFGAAVNTVGISTFLLPDSLRAASIFSVQLLSCSKER